MGTGSIRFGDAKLNRVGGRQGDLGPARFESGGRIKTSVREASDVAALPSGSFVVVSDTRDSLYVVDAKGKERKLHLEGLKGASELEGVTYDPVKGHLFVVREESRELYRYEWRGGSDTPKLEKKFELELDGPHNKGVEGLTYLPEELSVTGQAQLLAVKEGKPRQLLMLADNGKGKPLEVELEKQVKDVMADFSAVAVDPKTGHIYLASDESSTIAQLRLIRDGQKVRARLIQALPVRDDKDKPLGRIEGLTFNGRGDVFVLTENDGTLHQLKRR